MLIAVMTSLRDYEVISARYTTFDPYFFEELAFGRIEKFVEYDIAADDYEQICKEYGWV